MKIFDYLTFIFDEGLMKIMIFIKRTLNFMLGKAI